uniref:PGG domain-containing protein n=1 Tax=Picea sitchensis TaxID=3332 RepID=A9NVW3_PICSI|nr:unknown [Picea sitchensis]
MPSLVFDKCCGCIDLKTGCFIIGYLELVAEIILSLLILILLVGGSVGVASNKDDAQALGAGMLAIAVILLLVLALLLAFTITLLVGLHKNKRGHVKAYLIYSAIFLVLTVIMFFASFSQTITASNVISNLLGIALHAYFFLVIRSQYHKMDDANKGAIYNTA